MFDSGLNSVLEKVTPMLPMAFGLAGILYLWISIQMSRAASDASTSAVSYFLFLIGAMVMGASFSYGSTESNLYGIGRVLSNFAGSFIPVVLYVIYREYTVSPAKRYVIAILSIIPIATTVLTITNPLHHLIWTVIETDVGSRFSMATEHEWFNKVQAPFAYTLFGYSVVAMAGRLPTITRAHRNKILLLLICAVLPYIVSFANTILGIGPIEFPFTASSLVLLLPLYWWASIVLRAHNFSPLAYQTMFDHVRDPIIVLDRSQRIVSANLPAQVLLEASENELIGQGLWEDLPEAKAALLASNEADLKQTVRLKSDKFYELNVAPLEASDGRLQGTVVICRDVTERKRALNALADSEHLVRTLIEHSSNGILRFARDERDTGKYRCIFANRSAERYLRDGESTLVGMPLEKLDSLQPQKLIGVFGGDNMDSDKPRNLEFETELNDGETWVRMVCESIGKDFSVTLIDITSRKHNEHKILADALRDPLTGVLNRRGFEKSAADCIVPNQPGAVFYLDLNHFKSINDRFGHRAGDALLKAFGHRLEFCLRPEDVLARLGGDEFAIILPGVSTEEAKLVAERLVETAAEAYIIQGQEIVCSASVGIALMPQHGDELWHLVSIADQAMYNAKSIGQGEAANDRAAYIEASIASEA